VRTISYNFGLAAIAKILGNLIALFLVGILTRYLGPSSYGHYSTVMAYLFIVSIVADLGLQMILVREISQNKRDEQSIVGKIFTLRLLAAVIVTALSIGVVWLLPYEGVIQTGVMLASLFVIFSSLVQVLLGLFQKHLRLYFVSIADTIARLVQLGLVVALVATDVLTLPLVFVVVVISEIVHFFVVFWFARRITKIRLHVDIVYWRRILRLSLPIAASLVFTLLYFRIDTVFLSLMRSPEEVGVYSVAYKVLEMAVFIPALYAGLVMPKLAEYAKNRKEEFIKIFNKAFDIISIMAFPAVVFLFLLASGIVQLIGGNAFAPAAHLLQILTVAIFVIFYGNLGGRGLIALDLQKQAMWIYLAGAVINIITNVIFIPQYGAVAAAWTTVLTEVFVTVAMFALIRKSMGTNFVSPVFSKAFFAALIMSIFIAPVGDFIWFGVAVSILYFPTLFVLGGIRIEEVRKMFRFY